MSISKIAAAVAGLTLAALASTASAQTTSCYTFTLNHKLGNVGGEVMMVQKFLNMNAATKVAASGAGSAGMETSRFGSATKAAVAKFQTANGIAPVSGYWGPLTRAKANALEAARCASGSTGTTGGTTTPATGDAVIAAAAQPGNSLAVQGAARVPFTKFTVSAGANPVTLNSVTVERGGLAGDLAFSNVVLLDDQGNQVGIEKVLNSNHQATIGSPVVIPAGQTKTFTVAANMSTNTAAQAGQVAVFSVVAANASGTVAGSLPITGAQHTVNATLALGTVTADRGPLDPNASFTKEIGTTGYIFSSYKLTAGSAEKVRVWGIRANQSGSAASSDLANIKMTVDGQDYVPTLSSDGKYYQFNFGSGIVIDKGLSKEFTIKGDVAGGSGRTVKFDIYRMTDIQATGETYGYGITPSAGTGFTTSSNPVFTASTVTVNAGTFNSVAKSAAAPAANIGKLKADEILGAFTVDIKGEKVQIQTAKFTVGGTALSGTKFLTNVKLVGQNGAVIAGPVDSTGTGTDALTFSALSFPAGATTVFVKGQLSTGYVAGDTVTVSTTPSTQWSGVTGETSGNSVSVSSLAIATANTMTVKAANLTVNTLTTPGASNVVAGSTKYLFASASFDASNSGEDIRVSNVTVTDTEASGSSSAEIKNMELWADLTSANDTNGHGKYETRLNSAQQITDTGATNTLTIPLDTPITVAKNATVEVGVFGDLLSSAVTNGTHTVKVSASSAAGLTSGTTPTLSYNGNGQAQTTSGSGQVLVTLDASTPAAAIVNGNTTGVTLAVIKARASNEDVDLQQIKLKISSGSAGDLVGNAVKLYDGATYLGSGTFSAGVATVFLNTPLRLTKNTDKAITIKGDIVALGTGSSATAGDNLKVDFDADTVALATTKGVGVASGASVVVGTDATVVSADTTSAGITIYKSIPTVAKLTSPSTVLTTGTLETYRFSVTADASGDVGLSQVTVDTSVSGATVTANSVYVYAYTDAAMSQPAGSFATPGLVKAAGSAAAAGTKVAFDSALQIPAGQTRYFKVVATVTAAAAGNSISTKVLGDASAAALAIASTVQTSSNFVWSGNTNGTSALTTADWANGYSITGLPSLGTDTTVLSKN